jgi:hypothetical protein
MRAHWIACLVVAAVAWGLGAGSAEAQNCVAFVHGTGDQTVSSATSSYWTQTVIDRFREGRPFVVVGYAGTSYAAFDERSWGNVTRQIHQFGQANGCTGYVVITHSNGSNPLRYMLMHPTSITSATNGSIRVSDVTRRIAKVTYLAPDNAGTQLADKVTTNGTLANIANAVVSFLGLMNYNTPAVWQQRRDRMATYNADGTFNDSAGTCGRGVQTCGGVPTDTTVGTSVHATVWSSDAWCGGYLETLGLKATLIYAWGSSGCADGFLPCDAQEYNVRQIMRSSRLHHNQSRRDCKGLAGVVRQSVAGGFVSYSPPSDGAASTAGIACHAAVQGWMSWRFFHLGCPDSWRNDGYLDYNCAAAYGQDEHVTFTSGYTQTLYNNVNCPDSWRGDGYCDLCLVARYGYDALEGQATGADDCAIRSQNYCSDLAWDDYYRRYAYITYTAHH